MAHLILFHHVLGVTPGFVAFADKLREAGHRVDTPDLFAGRTFPRIEEGAAFVDEIGFGAFLERGDRVVNDLPGDVVYAGFSLGVVPAQKLAQTRPGAKGALFMEACVPVSEFGESWPAGLPVQIHGMDADPFFAGEGDVEAARALVDEAAKSGPADLFLYPGDRHLFADNSLPSYEPVAAGLLSQRVLDFLADV